MRYGSPVALALLVATIVHAVAAITKIEMKPAGNWQYSVFSNNSISIASSSFVLHGDNNAAVGLKLYFSCGRGRADLLLTPVDDKMTIESVVMTEETGEKYANWKSCSEVHGFKCLGMQYMEDVDRVFDYLAKHDRLSFEVTVDGRKIGGEGNFKGFDQLEGLTRPNCRH